MSRTRFDHIPLRRAHLDLFLAMAIVGSMTVAGKLVLLEFPIHLSMALRFAAASLLSLAWVRLSEGGLGRVRWRTLALLAAQAVSGVYLTNAFLLLGLERVGAAEAGVVLAATPAAMALLGWLLLRERPAARGLAGVGLAVLGVGLPGVGSVLRAGSSAGTMADALLGALFLLGMVVSESAFLLLRKAIREPLTPVAATCWVSVLGLCCFAPQGMAEAARFDFAAVTLAGWLVVGYYGAVVSVGAYYFWFRGVVRVNAATAGSFTAVMPLSSLVLSWLVLGERPGWEVFAGAALVVGAIGLLCAGPGRERG
jgi:drug/metabolite transporter (DMT)-like permease